MSLAMLNDRPMKKSIEFSCYVLVVDVNFNLFMKFYSGRPQLIDIVLI